MAIQQEQGEDGSGAAASPSTLKLVARYAMLSFAPLVAVIALAVAVIAVGGNRSSEERIAKVYATADDTGAALMAVKSELERIKLAMAQEKNRQEEERLRQKELDGKLIQNISQLQTKLKVTPTLEQQLQPPASAPAAASAVAPAPAASTAGGSKKNTPQVQAIKDAIEKYNKQ